MTKDILNQNATNEKSIHERMGDIDRRIIILEHQLNGLSICMIKEGFDTEKLFVIDDIVRSLAHARLQLNYYDEIIEDRKLQQQNPPLIIKKKD